MTGLRGRRFGVRVVLFLEEDASGSDAMGEDASEFSWFARDSKILSRINRIKRAEYLLDMHFLPRYQADICRSWHPRAFENWARDG